LEEFILFLSKRDIAGYLEIDVKTLYNWEKNKPNLYKTVMMGLAFEEAIKTSEDMTKKLKSISNNLTQKRS